MVGEVFVVSIVGAALQRGRMDDVIDAKSEEFEPYSATPPRAAFAKRIAEVVADDFAATIRHRRLVEIAAQNHGKGRIFHQPSYQLCLLDAHGVCLGEFVVNIPNTQHLLRIFFLVYLVDEVVIVVAKFDGTQMYVENTRLMPLELNVGVDADDIVGVVVDRRGARERIF